MLYGQSNKWYECLKDFSHLNGRRKQHLAVGDTADARTARFLFLDRVKHNWPSQWHSRYKHGYIEFFEYYKKFDLQNQTIRGKKVFLFTVTPEIYNLYSRQTFEERIMRAMDEMARNDRSAAERLIHEFADPKGCNQFFRWSGANTLLPALSLPELGDLAELLAMPADRLKSVSQLGVQAVETAPAVFPAKTSPVKLPASHTLLAALDASELRDPAELFDITAERSKSVPTAAAQSTEAARLSL
jgi:hypothetical protein